MEYFLSLPDQLTILPQMASSSSSSSSNAGRRNPDNKDNNKVVPLKLSKSLSTSAKR